LNSTIGLLLPLEAQRTGEEEAFPPPLFFILSLPKPKKPTARLVPSLTPPHPHTKRAMPCRGRPPPCMPPCPAP